MFTFTNRRSALTSSSVRAIAVGSIALGAIALGGVATPALAADAAYNATIAGQRQNAPLVNLASTSVQQVDVVNLPANVGLYALHCKVPADPRSAPTQCDGSAGALAYLTATPDARPAVSIPLTVNGEFFGTDPNPTAATPAGESVDCRVPTGNPRSTTCAVYVLGAGRESANPSYIRVFPTVFTPVKATRATDIATVTLGGTVIAKGAKPKLSAAGPVSMTVALKSGLTPTLSSDNCTVTATKITALKSAGACTVRIVSNGGANTKPLVTTQVFRLTK
jgi:hypothetical protein